MKRHLLTCAAVRELYGVCEIGGGVELFVTSTVAVVSDEFGINIDGSHIVYDHAKFHVGLVFQ